MVFQKGDYFEHKKDCKCCRCTHIPWSKDKKQSLLSREKNRIKHLGSKNARWKGGISKTNCHTILGICNICGKEVLEKNHWQKYHNITRSRITRERLLNDTEFNKKRLRGLIKRPTKPENIVNKLIKENILPYIYSGNGDFFIENFNPDFINCNGSKKLIEVFGDYWHNLDKVKEKDKRKFEVYDKYGFKTLVIWEHELKDLDKVIEKIKVFDNA